MTTLLFHAFFSTGLAYFFSWLFGSLNPAIAVVSLLLGTWIARGRSRALMARAPGLKMFEFSEGETGTIEAVLTVLIVYFGFRHFAWLFTYTDSRFMTLHPNNFGDLPLHINYIREMAKGLAFPPVNPSFASEVLRYPFGSDLYNALWECLGVPLSSHLFLVGISATIISVIVLRWYGGWWALGGFFFSGGLLGWTYFQGQALPMDLTQGVDWKNLMLSVFITQRGVLFALPMSLLLLEMTRRHFSNEAPLTKSERTTLGLGWGLLPLFHAHAFVIVSVMMGLLAMIETRSWRGLVQLLKSRLAIFAYIPATIFLLRTSDSFGKAKIIHWDGWWTTTLEEAPKFLVLNFGPWLILPFAVLAAILWSKKIGTLERKKLLLEFALYSGLFIIFFNVMLAPWAWDNIKVLIFPYLGFCHLAWRVLDPLFTRIPRSIFAIVLFASGATAVLLSVGNPSTRGLMIYRGEDLARSQGAVTEVPVNAIFASGTSHDHPLTFMGRLRAVGYEGHLWSHGIDYAAKMQLLKNLMSGGSESLKTAHELGVTHVYWGPLETTQFGVEPQWPSSFRNVSRVPGISVYEVR